jgi:beta-glucosidase/6-phospho-beta-glucosidase/beta-galactosidase
MINRNRIRVDLLAATGHDKHAESDYQLLNSLDIRTVREGICWSHVEKQPFTYDFTEVSNRIVAAKKSGVQQLWDICHFGYPDQLDPLSPDFCDRFVSVCEAFTRIYRTLTDDPLIITPVNEISFLSFLTKVGGTVPFKRCSSFQIKYELCKATIKAIEAIKAIDAQVQVMMVEPMILIHPQEGKRLSGNIRRHNNSQFEVMDIITGRMCPELGGSAAHMDLAGFNYYYQNQWEHRGRVLCWKSERSRRDFPALLNKAANRYGKPVVLSETGHFKEDRGLWMEQITQECIDAMKNGVDLRGICIYPVLDRPDWDTLEYISCGIWGYCEHTMRRTAETGYFNSVRLCVDEVNHFLKHRHPLKNRLTTV